jgi:subtilisin family serine protease
MRRSFVFIAISCIVLALATGADARIGGVRSEATVPMYGGDLESGLWFIELAGAPTARGGSQVQIEQQQEQFRRGARAAGAQFNERRAFTTLWNGLAVAASRDHAAKLARAGGVVAIWPVEIVPLPATTSATPDLATALAMTGADRAQSELGFTGTGIKVAIMDTGVDYRHPDLGGCFGPGCRVVGGWDFVGDAFNANPGSPGYDPTPKPGPDPMDCNGHGTHVAGIVGARPAGPNGALGVAPGVTFSAYRVFGCEGSTTADIMLAAMERTFQDGNRVLNMSIGSAFQWPSYPTAKASDALAEKGVVVVASIGNSGREGLYSAGAPGLGEKVIGVASFDNTHVSALSFVVNAPGDGRRVGYFPLGGTPQPPTSGTSLPIVHVGRGCNIDTYPADPRDATALILRGDCTFNEKYQKAVAAGARAVLIYNSAPGLFSGGGVTGVPGVIGAGISQADGLYLAGLARPTVTWTDVRINVANPTGGRISDFSSFGLSPDLSLKPDIGAPGGLIRSTYPLALGGYTTISGTSMSSPHVAGAVALLLEAKPAAETSAVRDLLQNAAAPKARTSTSPALDNVHRQGAGMLDIAAAVLASSRATPGKLALGASTAPKTATVTLFNDAPTTQTYALSHEPALATSGVTTPAFSAAAASVVFENDSVTVAAGASATVRVTITPPTSAAPLQYGGYIVARSGPKGTVRVPYAGFSGDYQSIVHLSGSGLPALATGTTPETRAPTLTVSRSSATIFVHYHLGHQASSIEVQLVATEGDRRGRAVRLDFLPRNATASDFFTIGLDPNNNGGIPLPPGDYRIELMLVKALGDPANPTHVERWTSGTITLTN